MEYDLKIFLFFSPSGNGGWLDVLIYSGSQVLSLDLLSFLAPRLQIIDQAVCMKTFLRGPLLPIYHLNFNDNPTVQMPIDLILIHDKEAHPLNQKHKAKFRNALATYPKSWLGMKMSKSMGQ